MRGSSSRDESAVFEFRRPGGTDRAAVDARGFYTGEKASIIADIASLHVAMGALVLVTSFLLATRAMRMYSTVWSQLPNDSTPARMEVKRAVGQLLTSAAAQHAVQSANNLITM